LAGVIQAAAATDPLMASAFTAMSTAGIELWSDARQAMIDTIGTAAGMTADQIAQVKALGVTYTAVDADATVESVHYVKAIVNPVSYPFSMAGWANVTTSSVVRAFLVQEAGSQSNSFGGYILNGVFVLQAFNGSANSQTTTNVSILNNWHHIVTIFTSSTSRTVYIDGILRATASDSVPVLVAPTRVLIGCNNESNQFFSGLIDTILLYDRVLTSAEITLLAASRNPFAATGNPTGILQNNIQSIRLGL
jgi:hypothetical protein